MEKVLITGVAGFIGSNIARRFIKDGYEVIGVDDLSNGSMENIRRGLRFIHGELALSSTISMLPSDCRKILHLAGQSSGEISFDDPILDLQKNTIATLNLIRYGVKNQIERMVYASSMSVYGAVASRPIDESHICRPLSCYGVGKLAAEGYLRIYGDKLPFVVMRMFNVYGPGQDMNNLRQGMVSIYLAQALRSGRVEVKGGVDRFRDFIFIDDVVEAWCRAATSSSAIGMTFNVGTGVKTSVEELLQMVCKLVPDSSYFVHGVTPGDQNGIFADIESMRRSLNIETFTPLDAGLSTFIEWVRKSHIDLPVPNK